MNCPLKGRNKILASICPQIYGLFLVKLAVALTLIGGCARQDDSGAHIRGEVHMLLIGDPGTGKSQASRDVYGRTCAVYICKLSLPASVTFRSFLQV
jgi:DNA replicative helicase MCM subunit Mcm2 (Cdc46/Mcm family)